MCGTPHKTSHIKADDLEQLRAQVRDAVRCHLEPGQCPSLIRLHISREEVIAA